MAVKWLYAEAAVGRLLLATLPPRECQILRSYVPLNKDCVKPIKGVKGFKGRFA